MCYIMFLDQVKSVDDFTIALAALRRVFSAAWIGLCASSPDPSMRRRNREIEQLHAGMSPVDYDAVRSMVEELAKLISPDLVLDLCEVIKDFVGVRSSSQREAASLI